MVPREKTNESPGRYALASHRRDPIQSGIVDRSYIL
jgi:hypothetical protein